MNYKHIPQELVGLAKKLRMVLLDVDGVLTDGGIVLIDGDGEAKRFDVKDGMGIKLAQAAGLTVAIVTSRYSKIVERRAHELDITEVFQEVDCKHDVLKPLIDKYDINASEVSFIGDDLQDMSIMKSVGIPISVRNATDIIKDCSVYVTDASGGYGAVREAVEWILDLRGDKEEVYKRVTG